MHRALHVLDAPAHTHTPTRRQTERLAELTNCFARLCYNLSCLSDNCVNLLVTISLLDDPRKEQSPELNMYICRYGEFRSFTGRI